MEVEMERKLKRNRAAEDEGDFINTEEVKQTPENKDSLWKRRAVRSQYREIEIRINEGKDDLASADSKKFISIMNEVEEMHQHVDKPREQVADAETLLWLTSTLVTSVKTHIRGGITPVQFVSSLIREFGTINNLLKDSPVIHWRNVGLNVIPIFMNVPGCMTMIGPMKNEVKQRKVSCSRQRSRSIGWKTHPKELQKDAKVVTDTDKNIRMMFEILKAVKKVKLENLLERNSFAQSVENLFALSFLVKDGRVRIDVDESGSQLVVPSNGPSAEEIKSGVAQNHSFIFRYDFDDWKMVKSLTPEEQELMPTQTSARVDAPLCGAKTEPGDKHSQGGTTLNDLLPLHPATVKKFSRNYGYSMQT